MGLYYFGEKVKDFQKKQDENPKTPGSLAMFAMCIGMNEITEKNLPEWIYRINRHTFEGHPLSIDERGNTREMTEDMLRPWIGLKTNVAQWSNSAFDQHMRKITKR